MADTVLTLDPTARGIDSRERYARSRVLLVRTLAVVAACQQPRGAAADSAQVTLARAPLTRGSDALGEAMMSRAIEVWAARPASCVAVKADDVLRLVQDRLAQ